MTRRTRIILVAFAAITIFYLLRNREDLFYRTARYEGDGTIVHHGSYGPLPAWYEVLFPQVPLDRAGSYHFHCRGLPHKAFTFELRVMLQQNWPMDSSPYEAVKNLTTKASVRICDADGAVLRAGSHTLREREWPTGQSAKPTGWALRAAEPEYDSLVFYHWNCVAVPVHTNQSYQIDLELEDVDPNSPHVFAVPSLRCSSK